MSNKNHRPVTVQDVLEPLFARLKLVKLAFVVGFAPLAFLVFADFLPFWVLGLFLLAIIAATLALIYTHSKCPNCGVSALSKEGLKSKTTCYHCGFELLDDSPQQTISSKKHLDKRAANLDWKPLATASANFDNYRLHIDQKGRLSFKPTLASLFFAGVFISFGIAAYTIAWMVLQGSAGFGVFFLLFVAIGLFLLYGSMTPVRINDKNGVFVLGWSQREDVPLIEIKAIQLLAREISNKHRSFANYQINLILQRDERKNVVYYHDREKALTAAEQLASTLGVKLWVDPDMTR